MIAIIGAGASGLVAAIVAARAGKRVSVYEKNSKFGRKILATGNGRCNITNENISKYNYHGKNPAFVNVAINAFNTHTCKKFFEELGLYASEGKDGRLYPLNQQSSSVVDVLVYECDRLGVKLHNNCEIKKIEKNPQGFTLFGIDKRFYCEKLLLATGGSAMPKLGSSESGYFFAKELGHSIIKPHASLVQLVSKEDFKTVSGLKTNAGVEIFVDGEDKMSCSGDLLFTNYGISGSAVLDISRVACEALEAKKSVHVKLDFFPENSMDALKNILKKRSGFANGKSIEFWLEGLVHSKLASYIVHLLHLKKSADELGMRDLAKIAYALKNFTVNIVDSKGLESAEVTAGGVNVDEVDNKTMASKLHKGLYFSGELLDIDGDCGGYNLHWAWASGYLAGKFMAKNL